MAVFIASSEIRQSGLCCELALNLNFTEVAMQLAFEGVFHKRNATNFPMFVIFSLDNRLFGSVLTTSGR